MHGDPGQVRTSGAVALHHRTGHQPAGVVAHAHPAPRRRARRGARGWWGCRPRAGPAPRAGRGRPRATRTGLAGRQPGERSSSTSTPSRRRRRRSKCRCSNGDRVGGQRHRGDRQVGEPARFLHAASSRSIACVSPMQAIDRRPSGFWRTKRHRAGDRRAGPPERRADLVPHERVAARGRQQVVVRLQHPQGLRHRPAAPSSVMPWRSCQRRSGAGAHQFQRPSSVIVGGHQEHPHQRRVERHRERERDAGLLDHQQLARRRSRRTR